MTILDRNAGSRIRIDATQLAEELAKRLPDLDRTRDQAASAVHDAAGQARHRIDRAAAFAREVRGDIAHSAENVTADNAIDEIGQRIRAVTSTAAVRAVIARLEKELPEVDRDKVQRAYTRGRTQARTRYLVVGIVAGVGIGAVAALLLDPKAGKDRRAAIVRRVSGFTKGAGRTVSGKAKLATDRARGIAIERGVTTPPAAEPGAPSLVPVFSDGPVTDPSSTAWEVLPGSAGEPVPADGGLAAMPAIEAAGDHATLPSSHG